jgi:hypothetical protein
LKSSVGNLGQAFETGNRGEGPRGPALTLLLHGGDGSLSDPVDVIAKRNSILCDLDAAVIFGNVRHEVGFGELFLGEGREFIEPLLVGAVASGVVGLDFGEIFEEDLLPVGILELAGEGDSMIGLPALEARGLGALLVSEEDDRANEDDKSSDLFFAHSKVAIKCKLSKSNIPINLFGDPTLLGTSSRRSLAH